MAGTTWSPTDKNAAITLGRNNLAAGQFGASSAWRSVRSTSSVSTGKVYFEITNLAVDGSSGWMLGVDDGSGLLTTFIGGGTHGIGYQSNGSVWFNAGTISSWQGTARGDVVGVAIDVTNKKIWMRNSRSSTWNSAGTANPATGVGGISITPSGPYFIGFSGFCGASPSFDGVQLNTGQFPFIIGAPSGFSPWDNTATPTSGQQGTSPTAWNPSDKNANITLSNSNQTASQHSVSNSVSSVRSNTSYRDGLIYLEATVDALDVNNDWLIGLGDSSASLSNYVGSDIHGVGFQANNVARWDAVGIGSWPATAASHRLRIAIDFNHGFVWIADSAASTTWNGGGSANPTTGVGGFPLSFVGDAFLMFTGYDNTTADTVTIVPGPTFTYSIPTGYSAWDSPIITGLLQSAVTVMA